jgi:serine/threonine protein kinase
MKEGLAESVLLRGAPRRDGRLQPSAPPRQRVVGAAAVKPVDRDVSAEVEVVGKVNHLNLTRLVGLCHHDRRWHLVTEFAEHGALRDRLLEGGTSEAAALCWAERVQVGVDVAEGLRYLHE